MEALPPDRPRRGAPEFEALRTALREMATALEQGRAREIEAERLRAFRETARRVAHEMRNPLTPIRLAVAQLARSAAPPQREAIEVLVAESGRLEQLAREFTEFGRLPEGPAAQVDLAELLAELARTSCPAHHARVARARPRPAHACWATTIRSAAPSATSSATRSRRARPGARSSSRPAPENGAVRIEIGDHGPGVPPDLAGRLFDPYVTGKSGGTGLGLALAKQTIEMHQGTIAVQATPGGGATFVVRMRGR